jgi:SecD/SecF fusion protein
VQHVRFVLATAILITVWAYASAPHRAGKEFDWRWGMDFNGGVQLVYQLKSDYLEKKGLTLKDVASAMEDSRRRLRLRVVSFHSEESRVALLGKDRILVEVPGVQDIAQVKRELGRPQYLTIQGILDVSEDPGEGRYQVPSSYSVQPHPLEKKWVTLSEPGCAGEHIEFEKFGAPQEGNGGEWYFGLPLNFEGQESFSAFTTQFVDQDVAILLDGAIQPGSILRVQSGGLRSPSVSTGTYPDAMRLISLLRAGPLPLPFELVVERSVSPVIAATRESSIRALSLGILILVLFFGLNYLHRPYFLLMALTAVALEVGLFVLIANAGWIRISLPQLAGLALLIGMSVDAFILVFEHIEQEIDASDEQQLSGLERAINKSQRAFATEFGVIFWASVTTVASLGGLYFVEGVLQEYFVLLALGVAISLSAAIFLRLIMGVRFVAWATHWASRERPLVPWLGWIRGLDLTVYAPHMTRFYKIALPVCLVIIVAGWGLGRGKLGIDFSGGTHLSISALPGVTPEQVREIADDVFDARCEVQTSETSNGQHQLTVRVPGMEAQRIGGDSSIKEEAELFKVKPLVGELLKRLESDLGLDQPVTLLSVEQLGSAAALDNTLGSLKNVLWGFLVMTVLCACLYVSLRVPLWVLAALVADMILVLTAITLLGIPVDYPMIAAFLTFAGYSINDSIVVCHSIKALGKPHMEKYVEANDPQLKEKIQDAIAMGLKPLSSRVFLTSLTTMLTMAPLLFVGDGVLKTFGLIFVLGTAVGTLSSIYIVGINAEDIVMGDTVRA